MSKEKKENELKEKKKKQYLPDDLAEVEYYDCHKKGHFKMRCP